MSGEAHIVVYEGVISLDVFGIFDALSLADDVLMRSGESPRFRPVLSALDLEPVRMANGVRVVPDRVLDELRASDTLVVPGCFVDRFDTYHAVAEHLRVNPPAGRCVSICTGAFVLAEAGLLDGLQATTHWAYLDVFREMFPQVLVSDDALYVEAGRFWTSAGVCAGIDLALALIRADVGVGVAQEVARMLVVSMLRPGMATQKGVFLTLTPTTHDHFHALQHHILAHVSEDLSVEALAKHMNMSPRHFARQCREHLEVTPAELVRRVRASAAHALIQCTDMGLAQIAERVGLSSAELLRRHIIKEFGVSPAMLRTQEGA